MPSSYSVSDLNLAGWLVYINGLEIPTVRVDTTFGVWQASTVDIQLIPHPLIQRIGKEDRLQVAVFYLDAHWTPEHPEFCLLGEFEVNGWSYRNSPYGRVITLHGTSQLSILDQLNFFYISSLDDMVGASGHNGVNASTQGAVKTLYPAALFLEGLTDASRVLSGGGTSASGEIPADQFIKRPIDFVFNIFKSILLEVEGKAAPKKLKAKKLNETNHGGTYDPSTATAGSGKLPATAVSAPGKNFFARWFKMTNFHRRWAALPLLEDSGEEGCFPIVKAAQETQVLQALESQVGQSVGNAGTAWTLLQKVLGYMLMEVVTVPAPPAAITEKKTGIVKGRTAYIPKESFTQGTTEVMSIPTFYVKPQCLFSIAPACNVFFPSMITNFSFRENYAAQPTRLYLGESFISSVLNGANNGSMAPLVQEVLTTGYPEEVRARQKALITSPESSDKNFLLFPEEFYKGPVSTQLNAPPWMYLLAQQNRASEASAGKDTRTASEKNVDNAIKGSAALEESTGLGALFDKYAKYEFFRARYAATSGGAQLTWNPYVVPGFPGVVLDQETSATSMMGYVTTVSHTFDSSQGGVMSSSVALSHLRPITDTVELYKEESPSTGLDMSPAEPIKEVGDAFQRNTSVQDLYAKMLFSGREQTKRTYFNFKEVLEIYTDTGAQILDGRPIPDAAMYLKLKPSAAYAPAFKDYTTAMKYVSRPACTLKEYIETWHGRPLEDVVADGTVRGEHRSFYSKARDKFRSSGAVFWGRIYTLVQGPGADPGVTVSNMGEPPEYSSAGEGNLTFVDPTTGMPQTRKNWDRQLEEYRKIIRSEQGKIAPLE